MPIKSEFTGTISYQHWYDRIVKNFAEYQDWLIDYANLCAQTSDPQVNELLDQQQNQSTTMLAKFDRFCIGVTGDAISGKAFFVNSLLDNNLIDREDSHSTADDASSQRDVSDDFPVLQNTFVDIPAFNENAYDEQSAASKQLTARDITFTFETDILKNTITPVILTFNSQMALGYYFLRNNSFSREMPIHELLNSVHGSQLTEDNLWHVQPYMSQEELLNMIDIINARELVTPEQAEQFGYDVEALPIKNGQTIIPKWRTVVINMPNKLLERNVSVLNLPALDSVYSNTIDLPKLMEISNICVHVINSASGILKSDAKILRSYQKSQGFSLLKVLLLNSRRATGIDTQIANNWQLNPQHIASDTLDIKNDIPAVLAECHKLVLDNLLKPELIKRTQQADILKKIIVNTDDQVTIQATDLDVLNRDKVQLSDERAEIVESLSKIYGCFERSDTEQVFQYLLQIINMDNFDKFEKRANSLVKQHTDKESIDNAKNILLSGIKLDIKRCQKHIAQLNNGVNALFKDISQILNQRSFDFTVITQTISALDRLFIGKHVVDLSSFYEQEILQPLRQAYLTEIESLKHWYCTHMSNLKEPSLLLEGRKKQLDAQLAVAKKNMEATLVTTNAEHAYSQRAKATIQQLSKSIKELELLNN